MTIREDIMRHGENGALRDDETLVREDIMQHGKSSTLREVAERTGLSVARVSVALDAISLAKEQTAWWRAQQQREAAALLNAKRPEDIDLEQRLRETVARGYCNDQNSHKEVDPVLLNSIVKEIMLSLDPACHPSRRLPLIAVAR